MPHAASRPCYLPSRRGRRWVRPRAQQLATTIAGLGRGFRALTFTVQWQAARSFSGTAAAAVQAVDVDSCDYSSEASEAITDLGNPASFFPRARALERTILAHLGPTNSGKTHQALQDLRAAPTGLYCGPLRLLAWQVYDQLASGGLPCNLVTGQERREVGAAHTACTTEMASVRSVVDVAVVDEIQMLADANRGWAFTRALLGVPARTLHVCGDPAVLPLLRRIAQETGDRLEVRQYERLSPLVPARRPLASLSDVQRGDCLVAFSRREVHALRQEVEGHGQHRCCVVYGALPPDARQQQAQLFNTPRTGFNVLAASDAVGMGLYLSIRRIVFTSLRKFDGTQERLLTTAEIKQVAGRAGRFGSRFPSGVVTATSAEDLAYLTAALQEPSDELDTAVIFPSLVQLELLHGQHPQDKLPAILRRFAEAAQSSLVHTHYSYARYEEQHTLATMLRHLPLSLREAWTFSISPTDPDDVPVASALLTLATAYAFCRRVTPAALLHAPLAEARSEMALQQLEAAHRIFDLYIWLSYRFPDALTGVEEVEERRRQVSVLIDASIRAIGVPRRRKGKAAPEAALGGEAALLGVDLELQRELEEGWRGRKHSSHKRRR